MRRLHGSILILCVGLALATMGKAPRFQEPRGVAILESVSRDGHRNRGDAA